jgi:uncharacterized pyridoxamine 5'-phosphate oxidase family protein
MTNHINIKTPQTIFLLCICATFLMGFKGDTDPLHKRVFNIFLSEMKDGEPVKKGITDKMFFKDGKMFTDYLESKFGYKWIRYRINKDSIYTDSTDTEVRYLQVEGSATNEDNQTVIVNFETEEWDIDGVIKITKNDKIKKYYDFTGREKGGKPKKRKSGKQALIEIKDNSIPEKVTE